MQINSSVSLFIQMLRCFSLDIGIIMVFFFFFFLIFGEGMDLYGVETLLFDTLMTRDSQ